MVSIYSVIMTKLCVICYITELEDDDDVCLDCQSIMSNMSMNVKGS